MSRKIIHIGLPKTATTLLQKFFFPTLCNINKIKFLGKNSKGNSSDNKKITYLKYSINYNFVPEKFKIDDDYIVSHEGLGPMDPAFWEVASKKIKNTLGEDSTVLIVIRSPKNFLTSAYLEECIGKGFFIRPERFFLKKDDYKLNENFPKFDIDNFDYELLKKYYSGNFSRVVFIKYENLFDKDYLLQALDIDNKETSDFIKKFQTRSNKSGSNKAISKKGVKILTKISKLLHRFGLKLGNYRENKTLEDFSRLLTEGKDTKKKIFQTSLLNLYRIYIDRYLFKEKFDLDFSVVLGDKLENLEEKYKALKPIEIINKK